ncbi:MAG: class I SAM-dependent methyltransferase [Syntrophorhabdales bacterium]|jgi:ubiquinone/menaquinone biosynthesis C-methylase UbiE
MPATLSLPSTEFSHPKSYAWLYSGDSSVAHFFTTRLRIILDLIRDYEGGKVLDVGCGPGILIGRLAERNRVVGLDISQEMIRECAVSLRGSGSVFLTGSAEDLPLRDTTFDVVVGMGVLEYVADAHKALGEFSRVAKKGGMVVVSMLNKMSPYRLWERTGWGWTQSISKKLARRPAPHRDELHLLSERGLRGLAESNGLEVDDVVYYDFNLFLPPLDRYMPRRAMRMNRRLEHFSSNYLKWIGTGFVVAAKKK